MKKVLKFILPIALLVLALAFVTACRNDEDETPANIYDDVTTDPVDEVEDVVEDDDEVEDYVDDEVEEDVEEPADVVNADWVRVALVAHSPDSILDDFSFNAGAWVGIQAFLATHGLPAANADFFQPHEGSDVARIDLINSVIESGFNILILPGFHFETSLYEAQDLFPDVKFVLLDASPTRIEEVDGERIFHVRIEDNVAAIHYAEHESGFLAGYAAVMDGHRSLGFMGGIAVPAVVRFGHGFLQGAEHAANSLGLEAGEVTVNYMYLGGFAPDPAHTTTAAAWFAGGTEVIFAAAGGAGGSVKAGAEGADALVIGVDVDQSTLSDTVITSAMKALDVSVYDMLTEFLNGQFRGGNALMFNAAVNGIGLPMGNSRFVQFTQAQYDAIFSQLASGAVTVSNSLDMGDILPTLDLVVVNEM